MSAHGCMHYVRLVFSFVGVAVGVLACVTFAVPSPYQHIVGSAYAFISAIFAAICLSLHVMRHRRVLEYYHSSDTLGGLEVLGFCTCVISLTVATWCLVDILYEKKGIMPFPYNPYISAVWSFMIGKWSALLWSYSRMYSRLINSEPLLETGSGSNS